MKLGTYLDKARLEQHILDGLVDVHPHPDPLLPLVLYCHTRKAVYDHVWDDITTKCRGLIVNTETDDIVARPFEKFFNYGDETTDIPPVYLGMLERVPHFLSNKLDGSLGIFWKCNQHWGIASKGSMDSEHSRWATKWLEAHVEAFGTLVFLNGYTPVFEMIAESVQHHVVDYGGKERLVLLAMVSNETGEELPPVELQHQARRNHLECVEFTNKTLTEVLTEDRPNHEGYVVTFPRFGQSPLKLKIKHPTFLKHQKIVHGATPKNVLDLLRANEESVIQQWIESAPLHVSLKVRGWVEQYKRAYKQIHIKSYVIMYNALQSLTMRKEYATLLMQPENKPYAAICFALMDEKDYKKYIWKLVEKEVAFDVEEVEDEESD